MSLMHKTPRFRDEWGVKFVLSNISKIISLKKVGKIF